MIDEKTLEKIENPIFCYLIKRAKEEDGLLEEPSGETQNGKNNKTKQ